MEDKNQDIKDPRMLGLLVTRGATVVTTCRNKFCGFSCGKLNGLIF